MSGGDDPKQPVADYHLSMHVGIAHQLDAIDAVYVGDRLAYENPVSGGNKTVVVDSPELFGGVKKEGGVQGLMHVLFGAEDQILPAELAARLGRAPETCPAFRGITSLFFTGAGGTESRTGGGMFSSLLSSLGWRFQRAGFYWSSNTPYLKPMSVKVRRTPKIQGFEQWASIVGDRSKGQSYCFVLDDNYSSPGALAWHAHVVAQVLEELKSTVTAGTRLDINIIQTQNLLIGYKGYVNVTVGQIDSLIEFITSPTFTASGYSWRTSMEQAHLWFSQTVADPIGRRSLLMFSSMQDWVGGNDFNDGLAAADDMLTRTGGIFNTADGTAVDCFTFSSEAADMTLLAQFDNTTEDGAPALFDYSLGTDGANDQAKTLIYSALFTRSDATVNPAHMILECLTNDDWGRGIPLSFIDLDSFRAAARQLFLEGVGLAMTWTGQAPIETFVNEILAHIDGKYGVDPTTGKIYLSLIRGGYDVNTLFELTPDNCTITKFQRKTLSETTNEVVVTYTNPENEGEVTVSVHDNANYAAQGSLVSSSLNYYGVRSPELAMRLAQRELLKMSTPLASLDIDASREAWHLKSGDVVLITYPEYGLNKLPIRIMSTSTGKPGEMRIVISALEDVFQMPGLAYVVPSGSKWQDTRVGPAEFERVQLATAPYYLLARTAGDAKANAAVAPEAATLVLGAQDNTDTRGFDLYDSSVDSSGNTYWRIIGSMYQAGWVSTAEPLIVEASSVIDEYANFAGDVYPAIGMLVWLGTDPLTHELAMISNIDAAGLHLTRGTLDTTPKAWPAGTPMWFLDPSRDYLDPTTREDGVPVSYRLCPTTSLGTLPVASAITRTVTPDSRFYRPYRPANVKIGGVLWPDVVSTADVVVTWSRRNRVLENPVIIGWTAADVIPEDGTTYTAQLYRVDTNALLLETTGITETTVTMTPAYSGEIRLELFAVRGGLESYQRFKHQFFFSTSDYRTTTDNGVRLTSDGQTRLLA